MGRDDDVVIDAVLSLSAVFTGVCYTDLRCMHSFPLSVGFFGPCTIDRLFGFMSLSACIRILPERPN